MPRMTGSSGLADVDGVVDDIAGVRDPLAADHELVPDLLTEAVAHSAVKAGEADAAAHRRVEIRRSPPSRWSTSSRSARSRLKSPKLRIGERLGRVLANALRTHPRSACRATTSAHSSGSWPTQPPQTISALFHCSLSLVSIELAEGRTRRQRGRALAGALDRDGAAAIARTWNASMTSSTWNASAPLQRCGRLVRIARARSARPMMRKLPSA